MEAFIGRVLLKFALDKLNKLLSSQFAAIIGVKKYLLELQDIHGEVESLLATVCDLSAANDPRFQWVIRLKDVAYDIDDLLFEINLKAEKYQQGNSSGKHSTTDILSTKPKSLMYRIKVARKVKAIREKLAAIAKQRSNMHNIGQNILVRQPMLSRNKANEELSLLTHVEESEIPTRDQEKVNVISKLLESNEREHGWIISIVGLGGSGKTTLAKHICHDNKIKEQFKGNIYWVHVSQELFDDKTLINKLFEAITMQKSDLHTQQHIIEETSRKLFSEKFLLVMDDAWHQDKVDWNKFMLHLKRHASGSKLVLTTRDQKVAEAIKSDHVFNLAYLSEVESWMLFLKSSELNEEYMGSEFIQVGKEIVNKCGGVPLAIKTLGGILSDKRQISTWRAINQSDLWIEENIEGRVFSSLKLSYIHLKDHVKECFVFCSIFPKGYIINKDYLIQQWIANGFVKHMMDEHPEVIGIEYLDLLVKVGFLEEVHESWKDSEVGCKMHDLIHDLTRYILQSEPATSLQKNIIEGHKQKCRYLCVTSCGQNVERVTFDKVRALCALEVNPSLDKLVKKNRYICSVIMKCAVGTPFPRFILKLQYLGYLEIYNVFCTKLPDDISCCWNLQSLNFIECNGFATLPESIGKLKKLRNIELRSTDVETLPRSVGDCQYLRSLKIQKCRQFREIPKTIGKNQNLRVLEIVECEKFEQLPSEVTLISRLECLSLMKCLEVVELPRGIGNLKSLEFLNIRGCEKLNWMPSGMAQLTCLKRLDYYVVGCGEDDAKISHLENLNMISGGMEIKNLKYVMDSCDAEKACLKKMKNLQNLILTWYESVFGKDLEGILEEHVSNLGVLDALEPPPQIKSLILNGYRGSHLPCWMSTQSGSSYYIDNAMSSQPKFLCLIELRLGSMPNLKLMGGIFVLPSLNTLHLFVMPNLEELWTTTSGLGIGDEVVEQQCFPVLHRLIISKCPKLIVEPYLPPSLEDLSLNICKSQVLSRGSAFPLLTHTSHHPDDAGPSTCKGASVVAPHLNKLKLNEMFMSVSDWETLRQFSRLETLDLYNIFECLTELPESMRGLTSLKCLDVINCSNLIALPEWLGDLRSLQRIYICRCPMINNLPRSIGYLTSLTELHIYNCYNLKQLPDEIQHLTSLEEIFLQRCLALTELPEGIGKLPALNLLYIRNCPALLSLPSTIQRLTSLERLYILGCPELIRRYEKEVGDDWHLVSHIPLVLTQNPPAS